MIPMVSGKIDLTVGYGIVLWHILAISLQTVYGLPWPLAVAVVLVLGALVGLINGILVEVAFIDSFIATLGTGTVLYAIALWHTGGRQVLGALPKGFLALNGTMVFGLPITGFYVLAFAFFLWFVLEYLPVGRYLYAIGANPRAAALNGIPVRRYTIAAFVASGLLTAAAGVLLASKLQDRPGERRPRISSARACRRLSGLDDDQARPRQRLGHDGRRRDPRGRHRRHSAIRRLVLGRADVQQRDAAHLDRHRRLRPAAPQRSRGSDQQKSGRIRRAPQPGGRSMNGRVILMAAAGALALAAVASSARADALVDEAKAVVEKATARADKWDGPTSGPKAVAKKTVVYVAGDMRNGGILGVAHGLKEAADVLGWTYREIDGQGTVSGQASGLSQAMALKPDAIVVGGSDAVQQKAGLDEAAKQGIVIVGWHAGPKPGPMDGAPVFANVTTDAMEVAKVAAMKAIADSNGKAGVVVFADSAYAIAIAKGRAMEVVDQEVRGLQGAGLRGHAARRHGEPRAAADDDASPAARAQMDPFAGDQRPLLRLHGALAPGRRIEGRRRPAEHFGRRRLGIGLSAHPRQGLSERRPCRSRSTCRAGSSSTNSTEPSPTRNGRASCRASIS